MIIVEMMMTMKDLSPWIHDNSENDDDDEGFITMDTDNSGDDDDDEGFITMDT